MYLALGIVFLLVILCMMAFIVYTSIRSVKKDGNVITKKNLLYLVPTYLILFFLYLTAAGYSGEKINFFYCFNLIGEVLDTLKFSANTGVISAICSAYPIFYADFVLAFIVSAATVILSIASLFSLRISNAVFNAVKLRRNCDIVIGDSSDAVKYAKRTKNCILLGTNIDNQRYVDLMKQKITVLRVPLEAKSLARKLKHGSYNVIVFKDAKYPYTKIIRTFTEVGNYKIKIHLEAVQSEMKVLKEKFISQTDGAKFLQIYGLNRYELIARRFVADYPITKYIPKSFYNENCTLKSNKNINVVFIGFGKVNYQLFRMCAMQFQFAQENEGKLSSKPVNYYIYDNQAEALHNEFFSRILFEFDEEFKDCDFPKPEKICELDIRNVDINSVEAKKAFKNLVGEDSFTYFVISLENDLEDASYAQTVKRLFERGDKDNYRIFVRAKNNMGERLDELDDGIIYFGDEKKIYTHENIVNDDLTELAQRLNLLYSNIADSPKWLKDLKNEKDISAQGRDLIKNLANPSNREFMLEKWSELPYIERDSNLYHALNQSFKLNLLGFDMVKKASDDDLGVSEAQFNERYINSGRDEDYADYSYFFKNEPSNVLAYIEHSRWNALYILYDYKQMKKSDMKIKEGTDEQGNVVRSLPHKNTELKQHACLTTYYGLDELIKFKYEKLYGNSDCDTPVAAYNARINELAKIYAYDYMDLDRIYSEITAMGYKLVLKDE
ncbi:MAG: hypothetical protein NC037_02240 [Bacteroides sp.]|nr:hypothetical protein [Bacillota bacterium]MCM1393887.1 hypothetical protein [[Eubacterium] siraeum]MCM1455335.1 hypothetical protein [Bacteroides sp.]